MSRSASPLPQARRRQRNQAVLLLLVVIAVLLAVLESLWWQPWREARQHTRQLAERHARIQSLLAQREQVAEALARAEDAARMAPLWMADDDVAQAVDGIAGRVDQAVALVSPDGQGCKVQSRSPAPVEEGGQDVPGRAALTLALRCGNNELMQLLHLLEADQPPLFLEDLVISGPPQYPGMILGSNAGVLDVTLKVIGFIQPSVPSGETP